MLPAAARLCVFLVGLAVLSLRSTLAFDPSKALSQFRQDVWTAEQGLPQNYINAVAQTPDGYLWIGTEEGVARFDGIRFTPFSRRNVPAFKDHNVQALLVDGQGALWIGTRAGGALRYFEGGFTRYSTSEGLGNDRVLAFAATPDGAVWIATNGGGVHRIRQGQITAFTRKNGLSDDRAVSVVADRSGVLWVGTLAGSIDRITGDRVEAGVVPQLAGAPTVAMVAARDGSVWMGNGLGELVRYHGGQFTRQPLAPDGTRLSIFSMAEDRQGGIWVGTNGGGLLRVANGRLDTLKASSGLPSDVVVTLFEDREGSMWIGTGGAGLTRLRDTRLTPYGTREGLSHDIALATYEDRAGRFWVGTYGGGLNRLENGRFQPVDAPLLNGSIVYAIVEDPQGQLWIGTGDRGVVVLPAKGAPRQFRLADGLANNAVYALAVDAMGNVWAGTRTGVSRYDGARWSTLNESHGLGNAFVRALTIGRDGAVWVGTNGGGVSRIVEDQRVETFRSEEPLANFVRTIHEDSDGQLWIGTSGGGLNLLRDGRFIPVTTRDGLFDDVVYRVLEDDQGQFWMTCNKGIFRAARANLLAVAEQRASSLRSESFGIADGMRSAECNGGFQPAGWRTRDGRLWYPTIKGVVQIDPARMTTPASSPNVVIEDARINRNTVPIDREIQVPAGGGDLQFSFTALTLIEPHRVRFEHRLDGFDPDWVDVGTRRVAVYTNIPPGNYVFRVRAAASGGEPSQDASIRVFLQPRLHQQPWFLAVCVVAIGAALGLGYRWRLQVLQTREQELTALVRERTQQLEDANRRLRDLSLIDSLTQIANRRAFDQTLEIEWTRSTRSRRPLSLLMIDIDHFKGFNDAYGHQAGDECLKRVAEVLKRAAQRAADHVSRYGGEEFAFILPDTEASGARLVAERVNDALAAEAIPHTRSPGGILTASIGVATGRATEGKPATVIVAAADAALYQAKAKGRNRVEQAPETLN